MNSFEILLVFAIALTVLGGLGVVLISNVLHAAASLLVSLLGVSMLYFCLQQSFLGVTQILIYIGGVVVLMVFGIMFTSRVNTSQELSSAPRLGKFNLVVYALGVIGALAYLVSLIIGSGVKFPALEAPIGEIGISFMTDYILPFEFIALALLIILIGTVFVAGQKQRS